MPQLFDQSTRNVIKFPNAALVADGLQLALRVAGDIKFGGVKLAPRGYKLTLGRINAISRAQLENEKIARG